MVGPNKFNYMPFDPKHPGPGSYGTGGDPTVEIGRKKASYIVPPTSKRGDKHIFNIIDSPAPQLYETFHSISSAVGRRGPVIKKDYNPHATMMKRVPNRGGPGPLDYNYSIEFMDLGSSVLKKHSVNRGSSFSRQKRKDIFVR